MKFDSEMVKVRYNRVGRKIGDIGLTKLGLDDSQSTQKELAAILAPFDFVLLSGMILWYNMDEPGGCVH